MGQLSEQTLYEILEVSSDATQEEIHKAFHRAKNTYSPSSPALYSVFSKEEAEELLRLIDEAYSILSNQTKRKDYDRTIQSGRSSGGLSVISGGLDQGNMAVTGPDFAIPEAEAVSFPDIHGARKAPAEAATHTASNASGAATLEPRESVTKTAYSDANSAVIISRATSSQSTSTGRTRFSHFDVNPYFEEEIKTQEVFDGTFLQKIRQYKGISLDQISEFTRIGRQYLVSVEANDFGALPAPVFVRGFLIQIARALGLDEKRVADSFMKLLKDSRGK